VTLPITITITATSADHFLAETPNGVIEATSLDELGDRLKEFLTNLEDEQVSDLVDLARLSQTAVKQADLRVLARESPPPDAWFDED
jgi:hypothetical protein